MVKIEYKILFEVRFLHDYYLTDRTGISFFSLEENAKNDLLEEKLRKDRYNIHGDFELLLSNTDQIFLKNHKMKLVKTQLGFFVGIEVDSEKSGGGKLIFRPRIPIREDEDLNIGLGLRNPQFQNITNLPLPSNEDRLLYFTNTGKKTKNILSTSIAILKNGQSYKMGDLSRKGNFIYKAISDNNGESQFWLRISGNGYVHQADFFPLRNEYWYKNWLLGLRSPRIIPFALLKIDFRSENTELSPIKENGYLHTEFLPSQTRPQHPIYELRFLGRSTYWRYKKAGGFSVKERNYINEHAGDLLEYENGNFITKIPHFLSAEMPYLGSNGFRLPSAKPNPLKFENEKVYSDIYFNAINAMQDVV